MSEKFFPARVIQIRYEAAEVVSILLADPEGRPLPEVDPGSHVEIRLPNGIERSYSLSNVERRSGVYRLTIARDAKSTGGSAYVHDTLRVGTVIGISQPRNNFRLAETAELSVFIAGGIGVTPFLPMISRLNELGRAWRLHYSVRTRERAALLDEAAALAAAGTGELRPNFDEEPGGRMLDLGALLRALPPGAHVYCCGPTGMLNAFRAAAEAAAIPEDRIHFEYFAADVQKAAGGGFTVVCARSSRSIEVAPGQTILAALKDAGVDVPFSCEEGVCGACETGVISGTPDHRDMILSARERAEGKKIMICCSGSKDATLVLDL